MGIEGERAVAEYFREALQLFEQVDDPVGTYFTHIVRAMMAVDSGDSERLQELVSAAQTVGAKLKAPNAMAHASEAAAWAATDRGDSEVAYRYLATALRTYLEIGNRDCAAHCLSSTAWALARGGRPHEAGVLIGAVGALEESLRIIPPAYERNVFESAKRRASATLDAPTLELHREIGYQLDFDAAVQRALELVDAPDQ